MLEPDYNKSIDFLRRLHENRRWAITAIHPGTKQITTATFDALREEAAFKFLQKHGTSSNLYYALNSPGFDVIKKTERADLDEVIAFHVDCDPRAGEALVDERTRILNLLRSPQKDIPLPSIIVASGAGYQALWLLKEPVMVGRNPVICDNTKAYNKLLENTYGGDNCSDVTRLLRLPYTLNYPDAGKIKKGRVTTLAEVVEFHDDRVHDSTEFRRVGVIKSTAPDLIPSHVARLPEHLTGVLKEYIVGGMEGPLKQGRFPSSSEGDFFVMCDLMKKHVSDSVILGIFTNPAYGISRRVLEKPSPVEYAKAEIVRAHDALVNSDKVLAKKTKNESAGFEVNDKGEPKPNRNNVKAALSKLEVSIRFNDFQGMYVIAGLKGHPSPYLSDEALCELRLDMKDKLNLCVRKEDFYDIITVLAKAEKYNPVLDYLNSLIWDGKPRIDTWLSRYGGAKDTGYVRAVSKMILVAGVRRVRHPGCKFDQMPIIEGPQGKLKSTALKILAVQTDWFCDNLPLSGKTQERMEAIEDAWIIEGAELHGMKRGDIADLKSFLSRSDDKARPAYGRTVKRLPRKCIIIGTTNEKYYLKDTTGNRRFWPVKIKEFDVKSLAEDRDQLWAEACVREAKGEDIFLDSETSAEAEKEQAERQIESNPYLSFLHKILAAGDVHGKIEQEEMWKLLGFQDKQRRTYQAAQNIQECMTRFGFETGVKKVRGSPSKCYYRGTDEEIQHITVSLEQELAGDIVLHRRDDRKT